jgi:hypothetical protein
LEDLLVIEVLLGMRVKNRHSTRIKIIPKPPLPSPILRKICLLKEVGASALPAGGGVPALGRPLLPSQAQAGLEVIKESSALDILPGFSILLGNTGRRRP